MKFFVAFTFVVAMAAAAPAPKSLATVVSHIQAIVAAIHGHNTDSATGNLLENILEHITAAAPETISVEPAVVEFPVPEQVIQPVQPIQPSPVVVGPIAPGSPPPLVQILVNINSQPTIVPITPVEDSVVDPVNVVEEAENISPVIVVDAPIPKPDPVQVVETAPVPVEPIIIGSPVLPIPVTTLPEEHK